MEINKNLVHQFGDQTRLYYDARSTNHQDLLWQFRFSDKIAWLTASTATMVRRKYEVYNCITSLPFIVFSSICHLSFLVFHLRCCPFFFSPHSFSSHLSPAFFFGCFNLLLYFTSLSKVLSCLLPFPIHILSTQTGRLSSLSVSSSLIDIFLSQHKSNLLVLKSIRRFYTSHL